MSIGIESIVFVEKFTNSSAVWFKCNSLIMMYMKPGKKGLELVHTALLNRGGTTVNAM